jgi:homoserine dehydrogenase
VTGVLGEHSISIASMIQKGRATGEAVPIVMMTHEAAERDVRAALAKIDRLPVVALPTTLIRVEGGPA